MCFTVKHISFFAPGEVAPEQAHALSVEFANRILGDKFEAVVATHIKTVQENLGHATAFTMNVYAHASQKMRQRSAENMEKYIHVVSG